MLKLFYAPGTCSLASQIVLEEIGVPYELAPVSIRERANYTPEYLAINPKARVPALMTDRGVITESPAILAYLAQSYPEAKLAPLDDLFAFAKLQAFNGYLSSSVHVAHAHAFRGARWADDPAAIAEMKRKTPEVVEGLYRTLEDSMFEGPWVMGEAYTVCDPYLFTLARWIDRDGLDIESFPKIADHRRRIKERPAVQRALETVPA
jgi:glutathione S-transferase